MAEVSLESGKLEAAGISYIAVCNTLNAQRLRDGGRPNWWVPYEPNWSVFDEVYEELSTLAGLFRCPLPPIDHCWIYHVWRQGRGFEPAGQRNDRYHLMYSLVAGERFPADMVPDHLCGAGRYGCVNPFHLRITDKQGNADSTRKVAPQPRFVVPFGEMIERLKAVGDKETA